VLDATREARAETLDRSGQRDLVEATGELTEDRPQLEAGEVSSEAEVLADAESEVRVRPAVDPDGDSSRS